MATLTYSLPEARERVEELQGIFAATQGQDLSDDQVIDIAATLIRRTDDLLAHLPHGKDEETQGGTLPRMLTQTLRMAAFLLMQEVDPDQAWYWTPENQARIREVDVLLTAELRAEVLAEATADYTALAHDPVALAAVQAEDALWDATVGDGLDAD
jgi:hypothetical protein